MMSDTMQPPPPRPWHSALREARAIALVAVVIAVTYNLLAATSVPWIYTPRKHDSTSTYQAPPDSLAGPQTAAPAVTPPVAGTPPHVDTTAHMPPPVDTIAHGGDAAAAKATADSVRLAREQARHAQDSSDQAFLAQVATMKDINTDVALRLYRMHKATFIDARPEDHFAESHITGALNMYAEQWQSYISDIIKIPKERIIITYCGGGDECELSHDLADHIRELQYKTVLVYTGGIKDWTAKKLPTQSAH